MINTEPDFNFCYYAYNPDTFYRDDFCSSCYGYRQFLYSDNKSELVEITKDWSDVVIVEVF